MIVGYGQEPTLYLATQDLKQKLIVRTHLQMPWGKIRLHSTFTNWAIKVIHTEESEVLQYSVLWGGRIYSCDQQHVSMVTTKHWSLRAFLVSPVRPNLLRDLQRCLREERAGWYGTASSSSPPIPPHPPRTHGYWTLKRT